MERSAAQGWLHGCCSSKTLHGTSPVQGLRRLVRQHGRCLSAQNPSNLELNLSGVDHFLCVCGGAFIQTIPCHSSIVSMVGIVFEGVQSRFLDVYQQLASFCVANSILRWPFKPKFHAAWFIGFFCFVCFFFSVFCAASSSNTGLWLSQ